MRLTVGEAFALLSFAFSLSTAQKDAPRPKGVGPEFAKFYKSTEGFACISNPSIILPVAQLNDDYCDCPDGSDEPGTSACSHLSPLSPSSIPHPVIDDAAGTALNTTLALPGFYCKNKGHQPAYVPFTAVNDGICDHDICCDGSDEWSSVGGLKCEDKCKEIGKEWRKADETRQKAMTAASRRRKELVTDAQRLRKEVEDRIGTLKPQMEGAELKVEALRKELEKVEQEDKRRVFRAPKEGGKLGTLVELASARMQELRDVLGRVRSERDANYDRLQRLEGIMKTFKEEYNPNFNDEGVKRAVRAWEDYIATETGGAPEEGAEKDLEQTLKSDEENGLNWDDYSSEDASSDIDVLYQFENYLPPSIRDWIDAKLRDLRIFLVDSGVLARGPSSDAESKEVTDARNALTSAESDLNNDKSELTRHEEDLTKDYGPDEIFRAFKGQCVSTDSGEYEYELCWLDKTTQKSKKGGMNTGMGNYVGLDKITVDEELPPDGRGLGEGERITMKYENGQHCWNGPARSTLVVMACAEKDEIWRVVEEEKCVYRMEVGTSAVCFGNGKRDANPNVNAGKDEL